MRWRTAVAKRRHDAGQAIAAFRRRWEAPGLVVIRNDSHAQLVLFMNEAARSRWRRRAANARAFRNQQHAPPEPPPDDMIEIYIAGSADVRKKNQPPPPGGYGAIAVRGGQRVFEMAGIVSHWSARAAATKKSQGFRNSGFVNGRVRHYGRQLVRATDNTDR